MNAEPELERARQISRAHSEELLSKPNVIAVGVGFQEGSRSELALIVMVQQKLPKSALTEEEIVPHEIEGLPVEVREVGDVTAQAEGVNQKK